MLFSKISYSFPAWSPWDVMANSMLVPELITIVTGMWVGKQYPNELKSELWLGMTKDRRKLRNDFLKDQQICLAEDVGINVEKASDKSLL